MEFGGNVTVKVFENDFAGVSVQYPSSVGMGGAISFREGGHSEVYLLVLGSEPTEMVRISIGVESGSVGDDRVDQETSRSVVIIGTFRMVCPCLRLRTQRANVRKRTTYHTLQQAQTCGTTK